MAARHIPAMPDESAIDLNAAIASTEDEILRSAMGEEELENDGDRSLEEMSEHPLDDDIDDSEAEEDGVTEEGDEEGEDDEEGGDKDAAEEEDEDGGADEEVEDGDKNKPAQGARDRQDRREPPPHRFREIQERHKAELDALKAENERYRQETFAIQSRLDQLFTAQAQAQRPAGNGAGQAPGAPNPAADAASAPPDMFADPAGFQRWVQEETARQAETRARAIVAQQMQELTNNRVNQALHAAATGDRGWEFQAAYSALTTSLNPRDPNHRAIVQGIYNSPDPAAALFSWWDANGGAQHRERVYANLSKQFEQEQPRRRSSDDGRDSRGSREGNPQRGGGRTRVQFEGPREVRVRMPPSLNGTSGGGRQQIDDPEMYDNSDESVMRYAMR